MDIYCDEHDCYISGRALICALKGKTPNGDMQGCLARLNLKKNGDYVCRKSDADADVRIEPLLRELRAIFPVFAGRLEEEWETKSKVAKKRGFQ